LTSPDAHDLPQSAQPKDTFDPLRLRATSRRLRVATEAAALDPAVTRRAVEIATITPSPSEWRRFLSGALAFLGTMLVLAGVICFVAYNWSRIGRYGKFAAMELAIVAATFMAWRKLPRLSGQIALFAASVLVGPLFALYGQTYRTGADPYGLFLMWALLIVPWAVVARFGANWVLVLLLLDVALGLYFAQILAPRTTAQALVYPLLVATMHALAALAWEWQLRGEPPSIPEYWALRVIAAMGFAALFFPAAYLVLEDSDAGLPAAAGMVALAAAVVGCLRYYRHGRRDRFMATLAGVAAMGMITVIAARVVFDFLDLGGLGLFVMAGFVVWQITYGVKLFRRSRAT
jgi:uncharacterized membrane protein